LPSCTNVVASKSPTQATVGIEREVAAESELGGHVQLDDLLPEPAGQHEKKRLKGPKNSLSGRTVTFTRASFGSRSRTKSASRSGATIKQVERTAIAPVLRQRLDQQARALQVVLAMQATQSERQNGLANFGEHRAVGLTVPGRRAFRWRRNAPFRRRGLVRGY